MADTSDPVATVFETAELLEMILLDLDMKTLLCSQRVSRAFSAVITNSQKLRRHLWLERDPDMNDNMSPFDPSVNPLIRQRAKHLGIHDICNTIGWYPCANYNFKICFTNDPDAAKESPLGSWRKMIFAQPYKIDPTHEEFVEAFTIYETTDTSEACKDPWKHRKRINFGYLDQTPKLGDMLDTCWATQAARGDADDETSDASDGSEVGNEARETDSEARETDSEARETDSEAREDGSRASGTSSENGDEDNEVDSHVGTPVLQAAKQIMQLATQAMRSAKEATRSAKKAARSAEKATQSAENAMRAAQNAVADLYTGNGLRS